MPAFADFVRHLLQGRAAVRDRPAVQSGERALVGSLLADAFATYRLDVAGPLVPFDEDSALGAAERLWWACWFLLNRSEPEEEMVAQLPLPPPPATAAQHLSADLLLRHLPQVHRRARALAPDDALTRWLELYLRAWPLSGVLADLNEPPTTDLDFTAHPGLLLLYAERLAGRPRPRWAPDGPGWPYVELVFGERNLPLPRLTTLTENDPPSTIH